MIVIGLVGLVLGYGTAAAAIKVKNEVEKNEMRADVGLAPKPIRVWK